jgi:PEP-CTERM motif
MEGMVKLSVLLASAALGAALTASGVAYAGTEVLNISNFNPNGYGDITGQVTLDVTGGQATTGTASLSGGNFGGPLSFSLVTADNYPGPSTGWRAGDGTDLYGGDTAYQIDGNGLVFNTAPWDQGYVFGIYSVGANEYQGALFGPGGSNNYYAYNVPLTVSAGVVPEPSSWAMMLIGFAGLCYAGVKQTRKTTRALV